MNADNLIYIGESGRLKSTRIKEHIADLKHGRTNTSTTAQHAYSCDKKLNPGKAKTLAVESNWRRRTIREALEIKVHKSSMDVGSGRPLSVPYGILNWDSMGDKWSVCVMSRPTCLHCFACIVYYSVLRCDLFRSLSASKARTDYLYRFFRPDSHWGNHKRKRSRT